MLLGVVSTTLAGRNRPSRDGVHPIPSAAHWRAPGERVRDTITREYDMKDILNFINGEYVSNVSGKTYEKRNPVDNSLIGMVHEAGKPEVDAAVAAAKAALKGPWGKLSVVERCNSHKSEIT